MNSCLLLFSQRRTRQPYGMEGGGPGGLGRNTWIKQPRKEDGDLPEDASGPIPPREINIGGKATLFMGKGDRLLIETPGGGAWGALEDDPRVYEVPHINGWEPRGSLAERAAAQAAF
jgi:5-oxoprolinase (ATP-hydrolysing)